MRIKKLSLVLVSALSIVLLTGCGADEDLSSDSTNTISPISTTLYSIDEDNSLEKSLPATDKKGNALTYSLKSDTSNGTLTLSSNGSFTYSPSENYFGEDSFTIQLSNSESFSEQVELTLQVKAVNDGPVIGSTAVTSATEDETYSYDVNASDIENDSLTFSLVSAPASMTINSSTGMISWTPVEGVSSGSVTVRVTDAHLQDEQNFTINVAAVNDAPTIQPINKNTRLDQAITFPLEAVDVDGDELTFSIVSQPEKGTSVLNENNTITYAPSQGMTGIDVFEVEVSDQDLTAIATVTIDNGLAYKGSIVSNSVQGVEVLLTADGHLATTTPDSSGTFKFYALPDGEYAVKVRKSGFKSSPSKTFTLDITELNRARTSLHARASLGISQDSVQLTNNENSFKLEALDSSNFSFHWEEDQSTAGYDYSAHINEPSTIEFLDEQLTIVNDSSANQLQHDLNILLVDSGTTKWTQEHAYRISEIMKTIPQQIRDPYTEQSLVASKWELTNEFIEDDIQIVINGEYKTVLISEAAFVNASPKVARVEGKRGLFYSQRLHHALIRFITDNGTNEVAYSKILNERYGVSVAIPDYPTLTVPTGSEGSGRFQQFHADEIVQIINMLEEMPIGMHKLPDLKYLVRRLDGTPHPLYSDAPAVAWSEHGYIEFMESAFNTSNVEHMHRLIIHEKSHFLWANQFDDQLKSDWIELGGWYEDSDTNSGWATSKQTEFVSAYSHLKNPNEDMAESISYFIINPDKLKSRAFRKYEFVRDRIMQGNIYISQIREDLTFQVYNLFPDYVFPGKIKTLDINVNGESEEDKTVIVEIELHALDTELEGAKSAFMRILSGIGTSVDLYLQPIDNDGNPLSSDSLSTKLRGSFILSKYAKAGFWRTPQITITDAVGNQRMEGANDFGWKLHINNPLEDISAPEYVANTATLTKSVATMEEQEVQIIHASWQVDEDTAMADMGPCYASMNDLILSTYRVEEYGVYDADNSLCSINFVMPHYMASSTYSMSYVKMKDNALNVQGVYFTSPGHALREEEIATDELPQQIELVTNNQDIELPELDLNNIQISAVPTSLDAPNGETVVTITFKVRDNISGYKIASLHLRDPQGTDHYYSAPNVDTWTLFPTGDPTEWLTYTRNVVLPVGSAPGTWGMSEMTIYDRAGNFKGYDFTEIVHFDVEE